MSTSDQNSSQRHKIIWILLAVVTFFGSMQIYSLLTRPPKYQPKYHTIAHRFLDLEGKYVSIHDESYELLDDIITEAKSSIHYDATITDPAKREEQLLNVFSAIDSILIRRNFIFPSGDYTYTLGQALEDHQLSSGAMEAELAMPSNARRVDHMKQHADESFHLMSCLPSAFLYMGVAEVIGFDLKPVLSPEHVFVRSQFDKDHWMNWDPNWGRSFSNEEYASSWDVADWQISRKIFMNTLSPQEIDAEMYLGIGMHLKDDVSGGRDAAIKCYRKALEQNPLEMYTKCNLALCLMFAPDLDSGVRTESLQLAQSAVSLVPNNGNSHLALGYAWAANGNTAAAVAEVKQAIQLDSENQEARDMLPLIESGYTMYDAFKAGQPISFWIHYENGWLYISIAVPIVALGAIIWLIRWRINRNISSTSESIPELMAVGQ